MKAQSSEMIVLSFNWLREIISHSSGVRFVDDDVNTSQEKLIYDRLIFISLADLQSCVNQKGRLLNSPIKLPVSCVNSRRD